jgi:hypothetical protein
VDVVDGYLMVFSRWAIHELRFDEREVGPGFLWLRRRHLLQAWERGRKVFAVGMDVAHHRNSVSPTPYREDWLRAQIAFRRKWSGAACSPCIASVPAVSEDEAGVG